MMEKIEVNGMVYEFEDGICLMTLLDENATRVYESTLAMEVSPNDPLTLEELREMDGDPVWVQPAKPGGKIPALWMLLECTSKDKDLYLFTPPSGIAQGYKGADYGKTWLAYRRKPEEGTA